MQSRLERNRDQWIDNPFTMMVLDIEQKMLKKQAEKAKLIVTRDGTVLDRKEYAQFVPKLQNKKERCYEHRTDVESLPG